MSGGSGSGVPIAGSAWGAQTLDTMLDRLLEEIPNGDFVDLIHNANSYLLKIVNANKHRWSWLLTSQAVVTAGSAASYALPSDFHALYALVDEDNDRTYLEVSRPAYVGKRWKEGWEHYRYVLFSDSWKLLEVPDDGVNLTLWYWRRVSPMSAITDSPDMPDYLHELLYKGLLYCYLERLHGERDTPNPKLVGAAQDWRDWLEQAVIDDRNRGLPFSRPARSF